MGEDLEDHVNMYNAELDEDTKHAITLDFRQEESTIRVLVCTVAFGMGVNIQTVRQVIHWGPAADILSYWQEIGTLSRLGVSVNMLSTKFWPTIIVAFKHILVKTEYEKGLARPQKPCSLLSVNGTCGIVALI